MFQFLSNLVTLVSIVSLASRVNSRPTEGETFNVFQRQISSESFFLGSSEPQIFPGSDPILAGENQLAFLNGLPDTSSFTTSPGSSSFLIADGTLCPGENRSAFCCGSSGCSQSSVCGLGETLNCCTIDPSTAWGYRDCAPVQPASST